MSFKRSEWLCREIVENSPDAVVYADGEGVIRLWNGGASRIFGHSREEAMGKSLDIIIPEKMRGQHWEGYRKVMETGETKYGTSLLSVPGIRKDGTKVSLEFTVVLVSKDDGEILGTAAVIRDVTERWERERGLKKRIEELEEERGRESR